MRTGLICVVLLAAITPGAWASMPTTFERGFVDDRAFMLGAEQQRATAFSNAGAAGARFLRLTAYWRNIAPATTSRKMPAGFRPEDPDDPRYSFSVLDRTVREASAAGLVPLILVVYAPRWAEGRNQPRKDAFTRPGTWRPDPSQLAKFMTALARRYDGQHSDALGRSLPRVSDWQVWNEPNLWPFLRPQWTRVRGRLEPTGADHYRTMLNSSHRALKAVSADNRVVMGGLAPFGDRRPGRDARTPPVSFVRRLFCLTGGRSRCPARVDVYAHHPYSISGPGWHAPMRTDASVADMGRLARVFRAAERAGTSLPRERKPIWVTELGWDTDPPDPDGVAPSVHQRWLSESYYRIWRAGVSRVVNLYLRDLPLRRGGTLALGRQSGVFFRGASLAADSPKPAFYSFRFPFVVDSAGGRPLAWGAPPCPTGCTVEVQRDESGEWRTEATVEVRPNGVFTVPVAPGAGTRRRAVVSASGTESPPATPRNLRG